MKLSDFDYHLPKEQIAQYPLQERDSARLLVLHRRHRRIEHRIFRELVEYLRHGDVLVLNNAKVLPVRLYGKKPTGGMVDVLLIKELSTNTWKALVKKRYEGVVTFKDRVTAYVSHNNGVSYVKFDGEDIKRSLNDIGVMPLPPYIKRKVEQSDMEGYQTVYAEEGGSIAAPTAGLHFTEELLNKIKDKGVDVQTLTLHIGYGTFKPVLMDNIRRHRMDEEHYEISEALTKAVNHAKSQGRRIIAVGTTVVRALETSALEENFIKTGAAKTSIFIYPGFKFKVIDSLITNFHLPRSTPMMLAAAFAGLEPLKKAYSEAVEIGYRFFSYGDAMLII